MSRADWLRDVQAVIVDESRLREPAAAAALAGAIARRAAADLPFGASPVDFAGEFVRLARERGRQ